MVAKKSQAEILSVVESPPEESEDTPEDVIDTEDDETTTDVEEAVPEAEDTTDSAVAASEPATPSKPAGTAEVPIKKQSLIRRLFTLVFWLGVLAAGIATLVFVVWPLFDREVLQSVESNAADTAAIEARLEVLEETTTISEQSIASLTDAQSTTATDLGDVEARLNNDIDQLRADLAEAMAAAEVTDDTVATLMTQTAELADAGRATAVDTQIVTAMELLARARLSLFQANYGLAATDVRLADRVLTGINEPDVNVLIAVARLDTVASNLPDRPVLAAADLDIAWQILLGDVTTPSVFGDPTPAATQDPPTADAADTTDATQPGGSTDATTQN